ncbi:unnamed protein product, partial [Laminaria digitata]
AQAGGAGAPLAAGAIPGQQPMSYMAGVPAQQGVAAGAQAGGAGAPLAAGAIPGQQPASSMAGVPAQQAYDPQSLRLKLQGIGLEDRTMEDVERKL